MHIKQSRTCIISHALLCLLTAFSVLSAGIPSLCLAETSSNDKNGVSPKIISLPSGPGSIEGLGESFQPMLNTGTARYAVKIALPPGVSGNSPTLSLQYDSGFGSGPAGMGWSYGPGSISRQIDKGLPRYVDGNNRLDDDQDGITDEADEIDTFLGPDGEELVRLADASFRARIEGNFARYRRVGDQWEADLKNGTTLVFGASDKTRVSDTSGARIFRWLLEKSIDPDGNVISYSYAKFPGSDNQQYLAEISYGPGDAPWPVHYFVSFHYEDRPDWRTDYRSGFLIKTAKRLARIDVGISGQQPAQCLPLDRDGNQLPDSALISRYVLTYNDNTDISFLGKVTRYGADGVNYLPPISFGYSSLEPPAESSAASVIIPSENEPFTLMDTGLAEFIDLNRDGLADILTTDRYGAFHASYLNRGVQQQHGGPAVVWDDPRAQESRDGLALLLHLVENSVNLADMNGDGLSDLVHTTLDRQVFYYPNQGNSSWGERTQMSIQETAPPAPYASKKITTADIDFNKRMDVVQSDATGYAIWFNLEDGKYSQRVSVPGATCQDRVMLFDDEGVQLADMNGDRLSDVAQVTMSSVIYSASMGHGNFAEAAEMNIPGTVLTDGSNGQISRAKLADINGDGLADLGLERGRWFRAYGGL